MSDLVYLEKDGNIAVVTLNKPERLNAMDETMWRGLGDIMKNAMPTRICVVSLSEVQAAAPSVLAPTSKSSKPPEKIRNPH